MSTNLQQVEEFVAKAQAAFEDGLIVKGPSREELFDSLKYFMLDEHWVTMTLKYRKVDRAPRDFLARVVKIEVEDRSMHSWMVSLEIMRVKVGVQYRDVHQMGIPQLRAYYNTQRREGSFVPQELSVRNGGIYRGSRKIADLPTRVI